MDSIKLANAKRKQEGSGEMELVRNKLRDINCYIGCRRDRMHLECEDDIVWPEGTIELQCERATSGHMILCLSHWNRYDPIRWKQMESDWTKKREAATAAHRAKAKL